MNELLVSLIQAFSVIALFVFGLLLFQKVSE
jgi:hypothetical protein